LRIPSVQVRLIMAAADLPLLTFADPPSFEAWLAGQAFEAPGAWLRFAKAGAPAPTIAKTDAIDCALAHGWIDGQLGRIDEYYFKTRFTPRRPRSPWSQLNCQRVARLIVAGRLTAAGQAEVDRAVADGRWAAAYPGQSDAIPDADLDAALDAVPVARALFDTLDSANRFAILYRVHQARAPGTRAAKIAELVAMLARGDTVHERKRRGAGR
jgi:uncharacterized protein YdeI (YjbR/CyaY-like superfamily)